MISLALSHNDWLVNEFSSANFSDHRLTKRFHRIMEEIFTGESSRSDSSVAKGRHRFLKNGRVELADIFDPHVDSTVNRLPDSCYLLNIQDTSGLNYHFHDSKTDIGHIGSSPNRPDVFGYWLHHGLLCDSSGVPLGISYQEVWSRQEWESRSKNERKTSARRMRIEDKESFRWLEGVRACQPYRSSTRTIVQLGDRESDIFEFFNECQDCGDAFVVRAKSNRAIIDLEKQTSLNLFEAVSSKKIKASTTVKITGNSDRASKEVNVGIRWCEVELQVPASNRSAEEATKLSPIKVNVIKVSSKSKVNGKPIDWIILTSLPIESASDAIRIVGWYALRWRIEIFFKTLKSGAKIEGSRLTDIDRISKYALMLSIKSFRVMQLVYCARERPNSSIREILNEYEWKVLKKILFTGKGRPTEKSCKVVEFIAMFGGFQPGKNRIPGILTVWKGWSRLSDMILGAKTLGFH